MGRTGRQRRVVSGAPEAGDIVWLNFTPQAGREQTGKRPALVLSPRSYNEKVGLMVACPITSKSKGYPFEVAMPGGLPIAGVILSDQVKSLDWKTRGASVAGQVPGVENLIRDVVENRYRRDFRSRDGDAEQSAEQQPVVLAAGISPVSAENVPRGTDPGPPHCSP